MIGGTDDDSSSSSSAPRGAPLASGGDDTGSEGEEEGEDKGEEEGQMKEGFSRSGEPHFKPKKVRNLLFTHLTNSISWVGRTLYTYFL